MVLEFGVAFDEGAGGRTGFVDGFAVAEAGHFEVWDAALFEAEDFAGAAEFEVDFGEGEAAVVFFHRFEAGGFFGFFGGREKEAVGFVGAATNAAAELVELGEAEAFGAFDEHNGGVGDVDADFDDGGGNEEVGFVSGEVVHDLFFFVFGKAAVEEGDLEVWEDGAEFFVFFGDGFDFEGFGFFD